jgi:hypothetical protein
MLSQATWNSQITAGSEGAGGEQLLQTFETPIFSSLSSFTRGTVGCEEAEGGRGLHQSSWNSGHSQPAVTAHTVESNTTRCISLPTEAETGVETEAVTASGCELISDFSSLSSFTRGTVGCEEAEGGRGLLQSSWNSGHSHPAVTAHIVESDTARCISLPTEAETGVETEAITATGCELISDFSSLSSFTRGTVGCEEVEGGRGLLQSSWNSGHSHPAVTAHTVESNTESETGVKTEAVTATGCELISENAGIAVKTRVNLAVGGQCDDTAQRGLFVHGDVSGTSVLFLVDTGSSHTVIKFEQYRKISDGVRPRLSEMREIIRQADGTPLPVHG